MQLYVGNSSQFIEDAFLGSISQKLERSFFDHFRYKPSPSEVQSWQNSLARMSMVLQKADLTDHGVILEHQLPLSSKRLDCMVLGQDGAGQDQAVVVELKQWSKAEASDADACVATYVGGRVRDVLHPSVQVGQYAQYLGDYQTVFSEDGMGLGACAYLHNIQYDPGDELFSEKHRDALERYPLFTGDRSNELAGYLAERMEHGEGDRVLNRVLETPFRPSRKLLQHTAEMIEGQDVFTLLDEQLVVFERVLAEARKSFHRPEKAVVLARGGPGTGKSVVALHLVGRLAQEGYNAQHATGSRSFTGNIRKLVGRRASNQFKYFNNYGFAEEDAIDVLVLDEAHRIRKTSAHRFTPKDKQTGLPQIEEIVRAAKVSVFFIDDLQIVRPNEVGSAELIRETAQHFNADLIEYELDAQFRCAGSEGYVNWVDNTLQIRRTANVLWDGSEGFDFGIVDSVQELEPTARWALRSSRAWQCGNVRRSSPSRASRPTYASDASNERPLERTGSTQRGADEPTPTVHVEHLDLYYRHAGARHGLTDLGSLRQAGAKGLGVEKDQRGCLAAVASQLPAATDSPMIREVQDVVEL